MEHKHHHHLRSACFKNVYVSLDPTNVTRFDGGGSGKVDGRFGAEMNETFYLHSNQDGTVSFESAAKADVFLRMDPTGVTRVTDTGSGVVNAQLTQGPLEKFVMVTNSDGTLSFRHSAKSDAALRLDGRDVVDRTAGRVGLVNAQYCTGDTGAYEKFILTGCHMEEEVHLALNQIIACLPKEEASINANRTRLLNHCCPPFEPLPASNIAFAYSPEDFATPSDANLSDCDGAIIDMVVDLVMFVLSLAGLGFSLALKQAIKTETMIVTGTRSELRSFMNTRVGKDFITLFENPTLAKAIKWVQTFARVSSFLDLGKVVAKGVYNYFLGEGLSWWQTIWRVTVFVMTVAAFATAVLGSGGALIAAEVVLVLVNAVELILSVNKWIEECFPRDDDALVLVAT